VPDSQDWQAEEEVLPVEGLYFPAAQARQAEEELLPGKEL